MTAGGPAPDGPAPGRPAAFYRRDGEAFHPSPLTSGPWRPEHQHGGPPSALLARALEAHFAGPAGRLARVSLRLLRPVPMEPLVVAVRSLRDGRRVRGALAELRAGATVVATGEGLWIREAGVELGRSPPPIAWPPGPEDGVPLAFPFFRVPVSYRDAVDVRLSRGTFGSGATLAWMRLRVPLVEGEAPSPWVRVLALADAANGTTACLDHTRLGFVNPDLDVALARLPRGDWIGLDGVSRPEADGIGLVDTLLTDRDGTFGRATQTLVIEAHGPADRPAGPRG